MRKRVVDVLASQPIWRRFIITGLTTFAVLWLTWAVILLLFAFATKLAVGVAVIASLFILASAGRLLVHASRPR